MGSKSPNQGLNPYSLPWKHRGLTTGPPGKSQATCILLRIPAAVLTSALLWITILLLINSRQQSPCQLLPCGSSEATGLPDISPSTVTHSWSHPGRHMMLLILLYQSPHRQTRKEPMKVKKGIIYCHYSCYVPRLQVLILSSSFFFFLKSYLFHFFFGS